MTKSPTLSFLLTIKMRFCTIFSQEVKKVKEITSVETRLEAEYLEYTSKSDYVKSLDDFIALTTILIDDIKEQQVDIITEIKLNYKDQLAAKVRNFFLFLFQIEEEDYYTEDNEILDEILTFMTTYIDYFHQLRENATEENYEKLIKLLDFLNDYYNKQITYYDSKRDALEYKTKGFCYSDSRWQDNRKAIDDFFNCKINKFITEKSVEKSKKMC